MAFCLRGLLGDSGAGKQGEGEMQGSGFHDWIRLVLAAAVPGSHDDETLRL